MGKLLDHLSGPPNVVLKESRKILDAKTVLFEDVAELGEEEVVLAWSVIDALEKNLIKDRKAELRDALLELAGSCGVKSKKGHMEYAMAGLDAKVTAEKRSGKASFDIEGLLRLLKKKGINSEQVVEYVPKVDTKELEACVLSGQITYRELAKVSTVGEDTIALKVKKPSAITKMLPAKKKS